MADSTIEILKNAILLERRGNAFYQKIAQEAADITVSQFFEIMADEENKHLKILSDQFKMYQTEKRFIEKNYEDADTSKLTSEILTEDLKTKISAAGFEAAAISAAMSMEERAINLYSEAATAATDPEEKKLYRWLAGWERQHLEFLIKIDRKLTESIWFDNHFWPF